MCLPLPTRFRTVISMIWVLCILGCDGVRTKSQILTVSVEGKNGVPALSVRISMKETWESWKPKDSTSTNADEVDCRQRWESSLVPWRSGVSNSNGIASLTFAITALDSGDRERPPADIVSNREYHVNLQGPDASEEVRLVMLPDAVVEGQFFRFTVVDIGKPVWSR